MRRYYRYQPLSNMFNGFALKDNANYDPVATISHEGSILPSWSPCHTEFWDEDRLDGDFPSFAYRCSYPVMSKRAWKALSELLSNCEPLPIIHPKGLEYYLIHIMHASLALNVERSVVRRLSSGRIAEVIKYSFNFELLDGIHLFRLPPEYGGAVIYDYAFKQAVRGSRLKGLQFKRITLTA